MKYNRNKAYEILEEFINICKKKDIWYSGADHTLLGAQRHGGFVPWFEKIQVMMTPESYRKLLRLHPKNVIDSSIISHYRSLKAAYVKDAGRWDVHEPFIEIIIVVPTTIQKIRSFKSPFTAFINFLTLKKNNIRNAINALRDEKYEGFYTIESRTDSTIKNWIPDLSFKTIEKRFGPLKIQVIVEFETILEAKFGKNYMTASIPHSEYVFPSPGKQVKESI